jgi:hypothetical protein
LKGIDYGYLHCHDESHCNYRYDGPPIRFAATRTAEIGGHFEHDWQRAIAEGCN